MKNILVVLAVVAVFGGASHFEHNYTREDCEVIQINDGFVTFEDECGFRWDWEIEENEYFEVGDFVDLKMFDNCSSGYVHDDKITKVVFKD